MKPPPDMEIPLDVLQEDAENPWAVVLLGQTGAGKSSLGNSLLRNSKSFKVGLGADCETSDPIVVEGIVPPPYSTPLRIIDTPGYGDPQAGKDEENLKNMVAFLQDIRFVSVFLLVLDGNPRFSGQIFDMLQEYAGAFGKSFFTSLVVVVTHWSTAKRDVASREKKGITESSFRDSWLNKLHSKFDLVGNDPPFVFIDNETCIRSDDELEAAEKTAFEEAVGLILVRASMGFFPCVHLNAPLADRQHFFKEAIEKKGLHLCAKCGRCFHMEIARSLAGATAGVSLSKEAAIATARILRVSQATSKFWNPDVVLKAMTRGWNASTGVHLFGKLASYGGVVVQAGIGVYRVLRADDNCERTKAVVGTSAAIAGGYGGASGGAAIGTMLLPGIGTIIGGIAGAVFGSVAAQLSSEKIVDVFFRDETLCMSCQTSKTG